MKRAFLLPLALLSMSSVAAEFNGTQPMICEPLQGHDCLPTEKSCKVLKSEVGQGRDVNLRFDVQNMRLDAPYRNHTVTIQSFGYNSTSLVMQGTDLEVVWSATVHRTNGRLTMVVADREGAYVVFGQCRLEDAKAPAAKPQSP